MAHGIGRHQQLEPVQTRYQVFFDVGGPHALGHVFDLGRNLFNHLGQKRACACGGVQHLNAVDLFLDHHGLALFIGLPCIPRDCHF